MTVRGRCVTTGKASRGFALAGLCCSLDRTGTSGHAALATPPPQDAPTGNQPCRCDAGNTSRISLHKLQHNLIDWLVPSLALTLCAFIALPLTPFSIPFLLLLIPLIAVLGARLPLYARFSLYMFLLLLVPLLNITYIRTRDSDRYFFQCEAIDQCWCTRSADVLGEKSPCPPVSDFSSLGIMPFSNDAPRWSTMAWLFDDSRRNRSRCNGESLA